MDELYIMPWYLLSNSSKKHICFGMHRFQNGNVLTIGPFAQLDFEMAASVSFDTKIVYS